MRAPHYVLLTFCLWERQKYCAKLERIPRCDNLGCNHRQIYLSSMQITLRVLTALILSTAFIVTFHLESRANPVIDVISKEVSHGCQGRGGTFRAKGIFEVDLDDDGVEDLVLAHQNLECNGDVSLSRNCGTQVCLVKVFLKRNGAYILQEEFLGEIIGYSWSPEVKFDLIGHGGQVGEWKPDYNNSASSKQLAELDAKAVPVLERGLTDNGLSCSAGSISPPTAAAGQDSTVQVRSGPSDKHKEVTELSVGDFVFVFDKRAGWFGIVYGDESVLDKVECTAKKTRRVPYPTSGWLPQEWVVEFKQDR